MCLWYCRIFFSPRLAGSYKLQVTIDGEPIMGVTQRNVTITHGDFSPNLTVLEAATSPATAGENLRLFFSTSDKFGNPYLGQDLSFALLAEDDSASRANATGLDLLKGSRGILKML